MTINEDGKTFVVNKMEWHYYPEDPITERSEDSYLYFAHMRKDTYTGELKFKTFGGYLGDYLEDVDEEGNAILKDYLDVYAWSEDTLQPPRPLNNEEK